MKEKWKIVGIEFSHMHMGDLLRCVENHPNAEIVGICDPEPSRMQEARENFSLSDDQVFTDYQACLEATQPDLVILCPPTAETRCSIVGSSDPGNIRLRRPILLTRGATSS